ncbi:unnamed protein product, partial [Iphiclides podalirius]
MTGESKDSLTKTFKYSFPTCTNEEIFFKLEVPVEIPYDGSARELVQRVINMFHIPVYLEDELNEKLAYFISEETKDFHNKRDEKLLNQFKNSEINVDAVVKNWEKLFKENVLEFAEQKGTSDEEVFAAAYHKLVHSPALDTILQVENSYAKTVMNMLKNRDEDIKKLTEKQTEEMEDKMRLLNAGTTEEEINELAAKHFEEQSLAAGRWDSQLDALKHTQRATHRAWLMTTLEQYQGETELSTPSNSPLATFPVDQPPLGAPKPRLEESFTIHLGSQLKQTHNIRLVAADMLDLCAVNHDNGAAARLQPALALYSGELTGVVVLAEAREARAARSPLVALAAASADHHFLDAARQLRRASEQLSLRPLRPGDVLLTRHGNLDAHVVFHLVVDDSLKSGDITSRHPAILGLRNILKAACCNDVTSISIPLLLRHEITEEMTAAWCVRRAELVLKCVKGFVLEAAGGGGAELRTLHAVLPPSSPSLFAALQALVPSVFRVSGPLRARTRPSPSAP